MPSKKKELIEKIKQKQELKGLPEKTVEEALDFYTKKYHINLKEIGKSDTKLLVKEIRANLRKLTGQFKISSKKQQDFLESKDFNELLKNHLSTKERLDFYPKLKTLLKTLNPKSILDLGCGINPLALALTLPRTRYHACDINESDLEIVKAFFKYKKIKGKVFTCDLRKKEEISNLPKADLTLLFKIFYSIEKQNNIQAQEILSQLTSKYILTSFPTKTLSGKPMTQPKRLWFENLLKRLDFKYKIINSKNEIFYLAEKSV